MEHSIIIPKHIAIIMDGNRRWASERGLPVLEGHRRVAGPVLEKLIEHAAKIGISYFIFLKVHATGQKATDPSQYRVRGEDEETLAKGNDDCHIDWK